MVDDPAHKEEWALVATAPFNTAWQAYTFWRNRWTIENRGFRELKEGWHLEDALWTFRNPTIAAVRLTFTLIVLAAGAFAVLHLEDLVMLLGSQPPQFSFLRRGAEVCFPLSQFVYRYRLLAL